MKSFAGWIIAMSRVGCLGSFAGGGGIFEQLDSGGVLLFYALGGGLYLKRLPLLTAQPPHCQTANSHRGAICPTPASYPSNS